MDGLAPRKTNNPADAGKPGTSKPRTAYIKQRLNRFRSRPRWMIVAIGLAVLALVVVGFKLLFSNDTVLQESLSPKQQASMHFNPLITDINDRIEPDFRFDTERQVFSFNDRHNGIPLTISQQSVPKGVESNTDELLRIARHINAENTVDTDKGDVYIASDEDSDRQTAVFGTDEVMVFIHSSRTLTFKEWQSYIENLEPR